MSKRYCCEDYEKPYKKVSWQDEAMDVCFDQESYGEIEDDIFGGRFDALSIDKKTNKQTLYEKELNKYNKDKATCDGLFYLISNVIPTSCVGLIKEYASPPTVYRQNYITRCDDTYLQLDKCDCYTCKSDRREHENYLRMEREEKEDYYRDMYYDW